MTCKREQFLSSKFLSFLYSQNDKIRASAPTLISVLKRRSIPWSQFSETLATLVGGYRLEAIWMTDHIDLAMWHRKNRCLIVFLMTKTHLLLPGQFRLARLSLIKITPRRRYQTYLQRYLHLPNLLVHQLVSDWRISLYRKSTENRHWHVVSTEIHPVPARVE
jgi:hypothetical protein